MCRRQSILVVLFVLALVLSSCRLNLHLFSQGQATPPTATASAQSKAVQDTVRRYLDAIYHGRAGEAWLMHSDETNLGESFDDFTEAVQVAATLGNRITIERIGVPKIEGDHATVDVTQRLDDRVSTYTFTLIYEKGQWKIYNPRLFAPNPLATPSR
jgi:hypothetical protein